MLKQYPHDITVDGLSVLICAFSHLLQTDASLASTFQGCESNVRARRAEYLALDKDCPRSEHRPDAGLSQLGLHLSHNPLLQVPTE